MNMQTASRAKKLFFKFVLFYFSIQSSLRNAQIACRIFASIVVFPEGTNDQFLFFSFDRERIIFRFMRNVMHIFKMITIRWELLSRQVEHYFFGGRSWNFTVNILEQMLIFFREVAQLRLAIQKIV